MEVLCVSLSLLDFKVRTSFPQHGHPLTLISEPLNIWNSVAHLFPGIFSCHIQEKEKSPTSLSESDF